MERGVRRFKFNVISLHSTLSASSATQTEAARNINDLVIQLNAI